MKNQEQVIPSLPTGEWILICRNRYILAHNGKKYKVCITSDTIKGNPALILYFGNLELEQAFSYIVAKSDTPKEKQPIIKREKDLYYISYESFINCFNDALVFLRKEIKTEELKKAKLIAYDTDLDELDNE